MRRFAIIGLTVGLAVAAVLAGAAPLQAEDTPPPELIIGYPPACDDPDAASLSIVDCAGDQGEPVDAIGEVPDALVAAAAETARVETALVAAEGPAALRKNCRFHAEVALYTSEDWNRLAQNARGRGIALRRLLHLDPGADRGTRRSHVRDQACRIRALGPRFHAMAEAHLTAWQTWVTRNGKTWLEAGREFRKRMAAAGYDVALGDLWALNEVPSAVRQGAGPVTPEPARLPPRASRGRRLDSADDGRSRLRRRSRPANAEPVGLPREPARLARRLRLLGRGRRPRVRFWAQEVYGDIRAWGVPTRSRDDPGPEPDRLPPPSVLELARAGGERSAAAESFLRRTYVPLANAAWKLAQQFFGFTAVDHLTSCATSSRSRCTRSGTTRGRNPALGPMGRFGFAWAPENTLAPDRGRLPREDAGLAATARLRAGECVRAGWRLATGACGPPGDHVWCDGSYDGAVFNDGWSAFATWEE